MIWRFKGFAQLGWFSLKRAAIEKPLPSVKLGKIIAIDSEPEIGKSSRENLSTDGSIIKLKFSEATSFPVTRQILFP